jgi:hypothetical protein
MARAMAAALADIEAPSAAEVYHRLRQSFPRSTSKKMLFFWPVLTLSCFVP